MYIDENNFTEIIRKMNSDQNHNEQYYGTDEFSEVLYEKMLFLSPAIWSGRPILYNERIHCPRYIFQVDEKEIEKENNRPCLTHLTPEQIKFYIYWRTEFENEHIIHPPLSCFWLYVYELILNMRFKSNQETFDKLIRLYYTFEITDIYSKKTLPKLIINYALFHNLYICKQTCIDSLFSNNQDNYLYIKKIINNDYSDTKKFLLNSGYYKASKSKFIQEHKDGVLVSLVIEDVFSNLNVLFSQKGLKFSEFIVGRLKKSIWNPFPETHLREKTVYRTMENIPLSMFVYKGREYKLENNGLYYTDFQFEEDYASNEYIRLVDRALLEYIVKAVENKCRILAHYRYCLSPKYSKKIEEWMCPRQKKRIQSIEQMIISGEITKIIEKVIDNYVITYGYEFEYKQLQAIQREKGKYDLENKNKRERKTLEEVLKNIKTKKIFFTKNKSILEEYISSIKQEGRTDLFYSDLNTNITRFMKLYEEHEKMLEDVILLDCKQIDEDASKFPCFLGVQYRTDSNALKKLPVISNEYQRWKQLLLDGYMTYPISSNVTVVLFYEIINGRVFANSEKALIVMADLWNHYYPDFQMEEVLFWIRDYWIIYCPNTSIEQFKYLFKVNPIFEGDSINNAIDEINMKSLSEDRILDFFNENNAYRIKTGKLADEGLLELLELCLKETLIELTELFNSYNLNLNDYFTHREIEEYVKTHTPFRRAIVLKSTQNKILDEFTERYTGRFEKCNIVYDKTKRKCVLELTRKRYSYYKSRYFIEYICKVNELFIRDWFGIDANFKVDKEKLAVYFSEQVFIDNLEDSIIELAIQIAVEQSCITMGYKKSQNSQSSISHLQKQAFRNEDIFDSLTDQDYKTMVAKKLRMEDIIKARRVLTKNQEKLIVEEYTEETVDKISEFNEPTDQGEIFINLLDKTQIELLRILVSHNNLQHQLTQFQLKYTLGILVVIDQINTIATDYYGESIIDDSNTVEPVLFDEYTDEIEILMKGCQL